MSVYGFIFKKMCERGDRKQYELFSSPKDLNDNEEIHYGTDSWNTLDVYAPKNREMLPVIISIHGGGYVYGNRETYRPYCTALAKRGFAVVNFSYHLAPKTKFPVQLQEINKVFGWVKDHIESFGGDPNQLFVVGDSAGAQMANQYITILTNRDYAKQIQIAAPPVVVRGVALNCGIYNIAPENREYFKKIKKESGNNFQAILHDYLGNNHSWDSLLNVPTYMTENFPPSYIMTAQYDFLKEAAKPLSDRLTELGVKNIYKLYGEKEDERYGHVFHLNDSFEGASLCNDAECEFFQSLLSLKI